MITFCLRTLKIFKAADNPNLRWNIMKNWVVSYNFMYHQLVPGHRLVPVHICGTNYKFSKFLVIAISMMTSAYLMPRPHQNIKEARRAQITRRISQYCVIIDVIIMHYN